MNVLISLALAALAASYPPDSASAAFATAVDAAGREAGGAVVGVAAVHVETGRRMAFRGGERFQMASVFKVPVAVAVLDAVAKGRLTLGQEVEVKPSDRRSWGPIDDRWTQGMRVTVERMLDVMLVDSDNTAADLLIRLVGGPAAVEKALVDRNVSGIRISLDEKGMGAGLPKGTEVFDKTGTVRSCSNDAGIVRLPDGTHLALVVFTRGGRDSGARDEAIARVARAAWRAFST